MKGVYFDEFHSYRNFNLILNSVDIGYPEVKTNLVEIQGGDGFLDLTEAFGAPKLKNRKLTFNFTLIGVWEKEKSKIANAIHGKKMKIIMDKDPQYYYYGRCSINDFESNKGISKLVLEADCDPYKYHNAVTVHKESITGEKDFICINDRKTVIPVIDVSSTMEITLNGKTYSLAAGKHKVLNIQFTEGYNRIRCKGSGYITFTYLEGAL